MTDKDKWTPFALEAEESAFSMIRIAKWHNAAVERIEALTADLKAAQDASRILKDRINYLLDSLTAERQAHEATKQERILLCDNRIDKRVMAESYDWTIDDDGQIHGLTAGDHNFEPTGIVVRDFAKYFIDREQHTADLAAAQQRWKRLKQHLAINATNAGRTDAQPIHLSTTYKLMADLERGAAVVCETFHCACGTSWQGPGPLPVRCPCCGAQGFEGPLPKDAQAPKRGAEGGTQS